MNGGASYEAEEAQRGRNNEKSTAAAAARRNQSTKPPPVPSIVKSNSAMNTNVGEERRPIINRTNPKDKIEINSLVKDDLIEEPCPASRSWEAQAQHERAKGIYRPWRS